MRRATIATTLLAAGALLPAGPAAAARVRVASHGDRIPRGADQRLHRHSRKARAAVNGVSSQLADGWCGDEAAADDVVDQAAAGNAIKIVYARPADVADHFAQYAPVIQAAAKTVQGAFLDATGGTRSLRYDVGTSCGANYVDIQSVVLPRNASAYSADTSSLMSSDLRPLVAGSPSCPTVSLSQCTHDFLVFADGVYKNDGVTGVATRRADDTPYASNVSNSGGQFAYVLGDGSPGFGISPQTTAEHETLHNLGAVQPSAQHYSGNGHCFDVNDVMCYSDGGGYFISGGVTQLLCPGAPESTIDCRHDDYFNPDGSVRDSAGDPIWNIYDSKFLCAAESCITGNLAPVAAFNASSDPRAGTPVSFDASPSSDEAAPLAAYGWDLDGDGAPDASGPTASRVFTSPGSYTVSLTVTDVGGARATATRTIAVGAPPTPPVAAPALTLFRAAPLSAAIAAAEARLRRLGGLRALVRGRALRVTYTPSTKGRLAARLVLGGRTIARAGKNARARQTAAAMLRLSKTTRRRLRRAHGMVRVRLAFTKR